MASYIEHFSFGRDERLNPFSVNGDITSGSHQFIYLTGRGQCSYLFPRRSVEEIVREAEKTIPAGYTQLWILEWITSVLPSAERKIKSSQNRSKENLKSERVIADHSYILLGDDKGSLGWTDNVQAANDAAKALASEMNLRIAVALLKGDLTWH
ncbi:MAG: hypothetical protein HYV29_04805 [Ignavibacteriales bacterium]|nr:hypothetical protein [Ignavibacteriales bacterium]